MKLKAELNEQIKHYASQLNKTEEEINKEIDEFGKSYPDITDKALLAHIWGTQKGISLPLKTILPGISEKYYLIHNLIDLAKKGVKNVNVRGYVVAELTTGKGNPKIMLADESGVASINIQEKDKWQNLKIKSSDSIYIEGLNIWKPDPLQERFIYTAGQFSAISKVPANNDLKMPAISDIKSIAINDLGSFTEQLVFMNGWVTATRTTVYLGCSNCRKKATVAEGLIFDCQKCQKQGVTSVKNQIKQMVISDNTGEDIICTLPPSLKDTNVDLLKGANIGLIGRPEKRDGETVFRIQVLLKNKESKSMEQQYKNASEIAVKYFDLQPNLTAKKDEFISWIHNRFPSLSAEDLIKYMVKTTLIDENGIFLSKKT